MISERPLNFILTIAVVFAMTSVVFTPPAFGLPNLRLTADPGASVNARVAVSGPCSFVVVWQDDRFGNDEILWQRFSYEGLAETPVVRLTNTLNPSQLPDVSVDTQGNSHIVWQEAGTIHLARVNPQGTRILGDVAMTNTSVNPRVCALPGGGTDVIWQRVAVTDQDVYYRRYNVAGTQTCERRYNTGAIPVKKTPVVTNLTVGPGDFQIYWRDSTVGGQIRHAAGNNACQTSSEPVYGDATQLSIDSRLNILNLVFVQNSDIYGYVYGTDEAFKISTGSGTSTRPNVGANLDGGYVAWEDSRDGNSEIYLAQFRTSTRTNLSGDVRLTIDPGASQAPDIAVEENANEDWVVVWQDSRDGNMEIYMTTRRLVDDDKPPVICGMDVPTTGLIGYWSFDHNANDESGNGNHGTVHGAILTGDPCVLPQNAYLFNGASDYIDIGASPALRPPLPVTVAAWVRADSPDPVKSEVFNSNYMDNIYTGVWLNAYPTLSASFGDGGGPAPPSRRTKSGTTALGVGTWYHVAAVIRGAVDMDLYVNGVNDGGTYAGTGGVLVYGAGPGNIGRKDANSAGPPYYHEGAIDEVYFYGRALSAQEISSIYAAGCSGHITGTVSAAIGAWPDTATATLRGLENVRVEVVRANQSPAASDYTDNVGSFSFFESYGATDIVRTTLENDVLEVTACTAPAPAVCNEGASATHESNPGQPPPIDLLWPTSGGARDVAHAFYFASKVGREYWSSIINYPPTDRWKLVVGDDGARVASLGGALTDVVRMEMRFNTDYPAYPDVVYHEFSHRMIAQLIGTALRGSGTALTTMAASMDEGLADYFTISFTNDPKINTPTGARRDLEPLFNLPCLPGTPGSNVCVRLQTCDGTFMGYHARVFGSALWELRKRLIARGETIQEIDRWIWGAIQPFALRIADPEMRTFLEFYRQLRDYTEWGTTYEPELTGAFEKFNIKDSPDALCYTRPVIHGVDRVVENGALHATAAWSVVPGAVGYNVYLRRAQSAAGLDLGMLIASAISDTFYSYVDDDTAAAFAFVVTALDSAGQDGPESEETPTVTDATPQTSLSGPVTMRSWPNPSRGTVHFTFGRPQTILSVDIYDITGRRMVRAISRERFTDGFDWDGRDSAGDRVSSGVYFARVRLSQRTLHRRIVLLD